MECNCNNQPTNYNICNPAPCVEQDCACSTILKTDCVVYSGNDLECSGIIVGQTLTETIEQLDTFICEKVEDITNALTLRNIGTGARVYKGDDLLGRKEIRRITNTGNLITITENTDNISVSINEANLNTFVENNQKTYSVENIGEGIEIYKAPDTVVGDNTQFNLKTLVSDTLTITAEENEVRINMSESSSIPALYINDLYIPTYEEWLRENRLQNSGTAVVGFEYIGTGSIGKPITNTIVYTLNSPLISPTITANTAIQNALDGDELYSYVGTGTRLSPEKVGQQIIILNNNSGYVFSGELNYSKLSLKIEGNVTSTTTTYLIDMDNVLYFNNVQERVTIELDDNAILFLGGLGFKNNGTVVATSNFTEYKQIVLSGNGRIIFTGSDIDKYLINSDIDSIANTTTGFFNDGFWQFEIRCYLVANNKGLIRIGGKAQVLCTSAILQTGDVLSDVDVNLKAFKLKGGSLGLNDNCKIIMYGSNTTLRLVAFSLEATNGFTPVLSSDSTNIVGLADIMFKKENTSNATLDFVNSGSLRDFGVNEIFDSPNLWSVNFRHNFLLGGNIDNTKADLTQGNLKSSVNFIGNSVVENLVVYSSKSLAISSGVATNSAFIKRQTFTAGSFVVGVEYKIATIGTTDYTLIGASANTVGLYFIATGVGVGTGTAYLDSREVL